MDDDKKITTVHPTSNTPLNKGESEIVFLPELPVSQIYWIDTKKEKERVDKIIEQTPTFDKDLVDEMIDKFQEADWNRPPIVLDSLSEDFDLHKDLGATFMGIDPAKGESRTAFYMNAYDMHRQRPVVMSFGEVMMKRLNEMIAESNALKAERQRAWKRNRLISGWIAATSTLAGVLLALVSIARII